MGSIIIDMPTPELTKAVEKELAISFTIDEIKEARNDLVNHGFLSSSDLIEELEQRLK
jgi:hypothetical protein